MPKRLIPKTPEDRKVLEWCNQIRWSHFKRRPVKTIQKQVKGKMTNPLEWTVGSDILIGLDNVLIDFPHPINNRKRGSVKTPAHIRLWLVEFNVGRKKEFQV